MTAFLAGRVWNTLLAFGENFDRDGWYSYRKLAWPVEFTGTFQEYQASNFFGCGSEEVCRDLFKNVPGGKGWATLKDFAAAHSLFKEITETGVLGIFPFGQQQNDIRVCTILPDSRTALMPGHLHLSHLKSGCSHA